MTLSTPFSPSFSFWPDQASDSANANSKVLESSSSERWTGRKAGRTVECASSRYTTGKSATESAAIRMYTMKAKDETNNILERKENKSDN
jgi:hypothetical protein